MPDPTSGHRMGHPADRASFPRRHPRWLAPLMRARTVASVLAMMGAATIWPPNLHAATLYHCQATGSDGLAHDAYSQQPCGAAVQRIDVADDLRTREQMHEAEDGRERQNRLAHSLQRDRQRWERAHPVRPPGTLSPVSVKPGDALAPARPHRSHRRHRPGDDAPTTERLKRPRHFTALVPKHAAHAEAD